MSVPVSLLAPAHTDTAACGRKSTKFRGIGSQLVEYHGNCLTRIGAEDDVRSLDLRIATRGVGRELACLPRSTENPNNHKGMPLGLADGAGVEPARPEGLDPLAPR